MKILVLGAGGIGGYFGGRMAESGADVTFLVRPKRRAQLDEDGLRIESPFGNARLEVKTVGAEDLRPGYDLVFFTCKEYDLESAMEAIAPAMTGGCAVVPMLNGLSHFDRLDARFGRDNVIGGTCQINVALREDGVVVHDGKVHRLTFGERDGAKSARTEAFAALLAKTKFDHVLSDNIQQELWNKLVFLAALAATCCLFRGNVAEINSAPGGTAVMERAIATNLAIAAREGYPLTDKVADFARARLVDRTGGWSASMLRDMETGKPTEGDHIVGFMLEKARAHGLDDSVLSLALTHLKTYDARRAARRLPSGGGAAR